MNRFRSLGRGEDLGPPPPPFRVGQEPQPRLGRWLRWLLVGVAILLLFIVANFAKGVYAQWLWFQDVGYTEVYAKIIVTKVMLFTIGAALALALLAGNLLLAWRFAPKGGYQEIIVIDSDPANLRRIIAIAVGGVVLFAAVIFGAVAAGQWDTVLLFLNGQSFGQEEPTFHHDIGFYLFTLPGLKFIQKWLLAALIVTALATGLAYGIALALRRFEVEAPRPIKAHLSGLVVAILLLVAWGYWLGLFDLNYSTRGPVFGATYTDIHAQIPATYVMMAVATLAALLVAVNVFQRGLLLPVLGIGGWVVLALAVGTIYPAAVQRFQVEPNELTRELPYIERNLVFTRQAYGLDRISERFFKAKEMVTEEELAANPETVVNIRLWDHRPLRDTLNQIQSLRPLYGFVDVDVDRYTIDGQYRQVMLAARELFPERLPADSRGWVNRRLQFTHGYGVVMTPVNEVVQEGQPRLFVKDIPPVGILDIQRPEIYFGEMTNDYVIVNTPGQEFDYPLEDTNVYTRYQGRGGVRLSSFLRRLVYAWEFGDFNILISDQVTSDSRILYRRNIRERIHEIAPFLRLDADPYIVIADGALYWIQDAYTVSDRYPYSQPHPEGFNYIRNSVKAVISAYDGSVDLYIMEPQDPLVRTWAKIFPHLFKPLSAMPPALRQHLRYPEGLFDVQAEMYRAYHMREPQVFYNKEDLWNIPNEVFMDSQQPTEPYYVIMRLPDEPREEFLLMLPFTPAGKDNSNAWLAARSDGEHYGNLVAFRFPKERLVFGPAQVEARIDQDARISEQFTLWSQAGSNVIRGNLLMIPMADSYLYVEPIYLQATNSRLPELRRVIVVNGNRIAMEPTLEKSLDVIFGRVSAPPTPQPPAAPPAALGDVAAAAKEAQAAYQRAQTALRQGDFAGYGRELERLEEALNRLVELTASQEESP